MNAKKIIIALIFFIATNTVFAQTIHLENINSKLNADVKTNRYWYFPNMQAYFDKQNKVYLYKDNGTNEWVEAEELPKFYGGYSLYRSVKVDITDYDGDKPYERLSEHKKQYPYISKGRISYTTVSVD